MAIRDWPEAQRPRERLLSEGSGVLSDAELLAVLLQTGTRGRSAVDLSRDLLQHFGSLRGLLSATPAALNSQRGLGPAKCAALQAAIELSRRHLRETLQRGDALANPIHTRHFLAAQLRDRPHEVFACIFLDTRHRVIRYMELFQGTVDGATVHPREIVRQALDLNAAAVIAVHNHPSGVAEPSTADRTLTRRLGDALALVDIRLLDHIIIGDGEWVSFAERGWI